MASSDINPSTDADRANVWVSRGGGAGGVKLLPAAKPQHFGNCVTRSGKRANRFLNWGTKKSESRQGPQIEETPQCSLQAQQVKVREDFTELLAGHTENPGTFKWSGYKVPSRNSKYSEVKLPSKANPEMKAQRKTENIK